MKYGITDTELVEAFEYLDNLRDSGVTNMFGAVPFMVDALGWDSKTSKEVLFAWMKTFDKTKTISQRVKDTNE